MVWVSIHQILTIHAIKNRFILQFLHLLHLLILFFRTKFCVYLVVDSSPIQQNQIFIQIWEPVVSWSEYILVETDNQVSFLKQLIPFGSIGRTHEDLSSFSVFFSQIQIFLPLKLVVFIIVIEGHYLRIQKLLIIENVVMTDSLCHIILISFFIIAIDCIEVSGWIASCWE